MKGYKETLAEGKSPPPFPLLKDSGRIYHHASAGREKKKKKTPSGKFTKKSSAPSNSHVPHQSSPRITSRYIYSLYLYDYCYLTTLPTVWLVERPATSFVDTWYESNWSQFHLTSLDVGYLARACCDTISLQFPKFNYTVKPNCTNNTKQEWSWLPAITDIIRYSSSIEIEFDSTWPD